MDIFSVARRAPGIVIRPGAFASLSPDPAWASLGPGVIARVGQVAQAHLDAFWNLPATDADEAILSEETADYRLRLEAAKVRLLRRAEELELDLRREASLEAADALPLLDRV